MQDPYLIEQKAYLTGLERAARARPFLKRTRRRGWTTVVVVFAVVAVLPWAALSA